MNTREVKAFFEKTDVYLTYNYNLRIRAETVGHFIQGKYFEEVLDMPCGTGDISAPFTDQFGHLTMMDFSGNMVAAARTRIPESFIQRVHFIHSDFYQYSFGYKQYDLVMNIGILAHIKDPWRFIELSLQLVKPGGYLIIQNTDCEHWFGKVIHQYLRLRRALGIDKYKLNKVAHRALHEKLRQNGLELLDSFSYNQSFLGFSRLFSNEAKYRITRRHFGHAGAQKGSGSDTTFLYRKKPE